jgi:hypothetical protein
MKKGKVGQGKRVHYLKKHPRHGLVSVCGAGKSGLWHRSEVSEVANETEVDCMSCLSIARLSDRKIKEEDQENQPFIFTDPDHTNYTNVVQVEKINVIFIASRLGEGTAQDPVRIIYEYYSMDGDLIYRMDPEKILI